VDLAIAALCVFLTSEAVLLAPLHPDAAFTLRQARAQATGSVPCRDIYCEYTPLVTTVIAAVGGEPVPAMAVVQLAILGCALLTYRLARLLGNSRDRARRMSIVTWALLLANEGRAVVFEPFTLICLLGAAITFVSSSTWSAALRSGLWIGLGFWTKQYALVGWLGLLIAAFLARRLAPALALTAGTLLGVAAGFGVLLALGTEPARFGSLFAAAAYPPSPIRSNLGTAPDLIGLLILSYSTITLAELRPGARPDSSMPFLMSAAALLPLYFRGYRHYWQLIIPFLIVLMLTRRTAPPPWARAAHRGAMLLIMLSVSLDVGRCVRDVTTQARQRQRAEAARLTSLGQGSGPVLYLADPAVLAWMDAPILAPRQVGPKFTRISRQEAESLLSAAEVVVWDPTFIGSDQALRRLARDPLTALQRRGFTLTGTSGPLRVYSLEKMTPLPQD
jgi:hypothetical protein